jgi:biofilm protein TabA
MIFDRLHSPAARHFLRPHPALIRALEWVRDLPPDAPSGIVEIEGREMFANIHGYETLPRETCQWESHRRTLDFQVCLSGGEMIEHTPLYPVNGESCYDADNEVEFWPSPPPASARLHMTPGSFAIFYPGELHLPKLHDGCHPHVHKVVVKIFASLLGSQ